MKQIIFSLFLILLFSSCEKESDHPLIGNWRLVKGYYLMVGGYHDIPIEDQRFEEYTKHKIRIQSDLDGTEISRCNYSVTEETITIYGENLDGSDWSFQYKYWFAHDTLAIKHDGGFEYYNEYFIREN